MLKALLLLFLVVVPPPPPRAATLVCTWLLALADAVFCSFCCCCCFSYYYYYFCCWVFYCFSHHHLLYAGLPQFLEDTYYLSLLLANCFQARHSSLFQDLRFEVYLGSASAWCLCRGRRCVRWLVASPLTVVCYSFCTKILVFITVFHLLGHWYEIVSLNRMPPFVTPKRACPSGPT